MKILDTPMAINSQRYERLMSIPKNRDTIKTLLSLYVKIDLHGTPMSAKNCDTTDEFIKMIQMKMSGEARYSFNDPNKDWITAHMAKHHYPIPKDNIAYLCNCPMCANGYYGKSGKELTHAAVVHEFMKSGGKRLVTRFEQLTQINQNQATNQG